MISYELAKKLKEAGFTQKAGYAPLYYYKEGNPDGKVREAIVAPTESDVVQMVYVPHLSELIEACGDGYLILTKTPDICSVSYGDFVLLGQTILNSLGKTPEEAVANLWLAINTPPTG